VKDGLVSRVDALVDELRGRMGRSAEELDLSRDSLDLVSEYVEGIGVERAQQELYDQLVAYVGEVMRLRVNGRWAVNSGDRQLHPYVLSEQCVLMPINVVYEQLMGLAPVNLGRAVRREMGEVRRPPSPLPADTVPAKPPTGVLGDIPADAYEVQKRHHDGRPWVVFFTLEVTIGGIACRGKALFHRLSGEAIGVTLSREQSVSGRRLSAGTYVQYLRRQSDRRLWHVELGEDQEIDGLPCRRGIFTEFHANQHLSGAVLAADCEIAGIPSAAGSTVGFHKNGCLSQTVLAREHVISGRAFPARTHVCFDKRGRLYRAWFQQDWEIDGHPVKGATSLDFAPDGQLRDYSLWALERRPG
jgi:hypothetical protein